MPNGKLIEFANTLYGQKQIPYIDQVPAYGIWTMESSDSIYTLGFQPSFAILSQMDSRVSTQTQLLAAFITSTPSRASFALLRNESSVYATIMSRNMAQTFFSTGIRATNLGIRSETFPKTYFVIAFR